MTLLRNYFKKGWERSRERRKWRNRCLLSVLVVALGAYLYFKYQERVSPVLLSLKPFGCDHFSASGQDAHRDALGELNYSVQLCCEYTGNPLSASVSLIESARPSQLINLMKQDLRGYLKGQRNAQAPCKTGCLRLPEEMDETWLASLTLDEGHPEGSEGGNPTDPAGADSWNTGHLFFPAAGKPCDHRAADGRSSAI